MCNTISSTVSKNNQISSLVLCQLNANESVAGWGDASSSGVSDSREKITSHLPRCLLCVWQRFGWLFGCGQPTPYRRYGPVAIIHTYIRFIHSFSAHIRHLSVHSDIVTYIDIHSEYTNDNHSHSVNHYRYIHSHWLYTLTYMVFDIHSARLVSRFHVCITVFSQSENAFIHYLVTVRCALAGLSTDDGRDPVSAEVAWG